MGYGLHCKIKGIFITNALDGDDGVFPHDEADKSCLLLHPNALRAGLLKKGEKEHY